MRLQTILAELEATAPLSFAEDWDNVGLLTGDPDANVEQVLLTIDATPAVFAEAQQKGVHLLVSYHPLLLKPVRRLGPHDLLTLATRRGLAVYSPHTALDAAVGGTNDTLADLCGVGERVPLSESEPAGVVAQGHRAAAAAAGVAAARAPNAHVGAGRVGELRHNEQLSLALLAERLRQGAGLGHVQYAAAAAAELRPLRRVACAAGAGDSLVPHALRARADVLVTGELRHHALLACLRADLSVVLLGHDGSERPALAALQRRLARRLPELNITQSEADDSPLQLCAAPAPPQR